MIVEVGFLTYVIGILMSTYSILQTSLDQTMDRRLMEEASVAVPSIARTDCVKMQREMFGVLASGLSREAAQAFHGELERRGLKTEVVWDGDIPVLHDTCQQRHMARRGEGLFLADAMGREMARPLEQLVFVAAGFIEDGRMGKAPKFRLDAFFTSSPNRVHLQLTEDSVIFLHGDMIRLKQRAVLRDACDRIAGWLPNDRLSQYLSRRDGRSIYPSMQCYEEEIRWHFYQLAPKT